MKKNLFSSFLLKIYCYKQYIWSSIGSHGRSPCTNSGRNKYMGVSFFLVPRRELKKTFDDEIERPELSVVSMPRELYVNSILLRLREFFRLMVEQYECFLFIHFLEQFWEICTMSPETRCRNIISSYNNYSSYFEPFVL